MVTVPIIPVMPGGGESRRRAWLWARRLGLVVLTSVAAAVVALVVVSVVLHVQGQTTGPLEFAVVELAWLAHGGPWQTSVGGFEYEYESDGPGGRVRYLIRLSIHPPEHPREGVFEYRTERYRLASGGQMTKPAFVTWGAVELSERELPPVEAAIRAWSGPRRLVLKAEGGRRHPRFEFTGMIEVSGWKGGYQDWRRRDYLVSGVGQEPPSELAELLRSVESALPARVGSRFPLPGITPPPPLRAKEGA
jgi:hypothetical protein